eukprot:4362681-Lingulodinium_polyedra.AAC.1
MRKASPRPSKVSIVKGSTGDASLRPLAATRVTCLVSPTLPSLSRALDSEMWSWPTPESTIWRGDTSIAST